MPQRNRPPMHRIALAASVLAATLAAAFADADAGPPPNTAYLQPMQGLSQDEMQQFRSGEIMFRTVWLVFPGMPVQNNWAYMRPSSGYAWGLGPTFVATACVACHVQAGHAGTVDRRHVRQGEADLYVDWQPVPAKLDDDTPVELRRPAIRVEGLAFGPLGKDTLTSLRNARAIFGLGYLQAVSEQDILRLAAEQRAQGILWHGGEAGPSRKAFSQMNREDREVLLAFVNSL